MLSGGVSSRGRFNGVVSLRDAILAQELGNGSNTRTNFKEKEQVGDRELVGIETRIIWGIEKRKSKEKKQLITPPYY